MARMSFLLDEYDRLVESSRLSVADRRCMPNHAHAQQLYTMAVLANSHQLDLQRMFRGRATEVIAEAMRFRQDSELKLFTLLVEHYPEHSPVMLNFAAQLASYAGSLFKCMLCADSEDMSASTPVPLHEVLAHWRQYHPDVLLNLGGPSSLSTVTPPSNAHDGVSVVKPCLDSWNYLQASPISTDSTLETMDDLVARGLVYCPCRISLHHRYTWADLVRNTRARGWGRKTDSMSRSSAIA